MLYLLDANVLIRAHEDYYQIDRVPQFWDWLVGVAIAGLVKMPFEIHGEIAIANGPLKEWVCDSAVKSALVLDEVVSSQLVQEVLTKGYGGTLSDSDLEKIGQDAFLIAYGLVDAQRVIVTKENSRPSAKNGNRKIPDVCNDLGVKWTRDFELYRLLNFSTAIK